MTHQILAGDIGGTNSRFVLYEVQETDRLPQQPRHVTPPGKSILTKEYSNEDYEKFVDVVQQFLKDAGCSSCYPVTACFAVAGPVDSNMVSFTNRAEWNIDGNALAETLGIKKLRLVNDLVAVGYGLLTLSEEESDVVTLQDAEVRYDSPMACIAPGTGLGECFLTPTGDGFYEVYPSEGGHAEFPPTSDKEFSLLKYLRQKFNDEKPPGHTSARISVERIVSGNGLANVYDFLIKYKDECKSTPDEEVAKKFLSLEGSERGKFVAESAKTDPTCQEAMDIMFGALGCETGTMGLKFLPYGGLYLAGGIPPKNIDRLKGCKRFKQAFHDKGRVSKILSHVPLKVVMNDKVGRQGAHLLAFKMFQELVEDGKLTHDSDGEQ